MTSTNNKTTWSAIQAATLGILLCLILSIGCSQMIKRGQSPDLESMEFREGSNAQYVADLCTPWGLNTMKVEGLALVTQLDDTGSDPAPSAQRDHLVSEIKTHNIDDIPGLLASKANAMAPVRGEIPACARKGDRFDLFIGQVPRAKTTSLRGGYMMQTRLKPLLVLEKSVKQGQTAALARGHVLVDAMFDSSGNESRELEGMCLGGGVVLEDRVAGLVIRDDAKIEFKDSVNRATAICRAINARFTTRDHTGPRGVADLKNDRQVQVDVPDEYRHNVGRFFHVVLNIAFNETPEDRVNRLEWLEGELNDPTRASLAAIRLEAVGSEAVPALQRALRSSDEEVRFHAAQALAYMDEPASIGELTAAARSEPAFRWHALTALATFKNPDGEAALRSLFDAESAEARYGAFRALSKSFPRSVTVVGQDVGAGFTLHSAPSRSRPMIHFSRSSRQEIVFFGEPAVFGERFVYLQAGLTIKAVSDTEVQLKRFLPNDGEKIARCSNRVDDVIRHAVRFGANYGDVLAILKSAKRSDALDAQLVINAVPNLSKSYRHTARNSEDYSNESSSRFIPEPVPDLFDQTSDSAGQYTSARVEGLSGGGPDSKKGFFDKMKLWRRSP